MKTTLLPILVSILFLVPVAFAQELPTKGSIVILDNDELIEGDITRVGDVCRIRRGTGETALPISRVRHIVSSRPEALAAMRKSLDPKNPLDYYKLAVWCYRQGMIADAVVAADEAVALSPTNRGFVRYAQSMKDLAARPTTATAVPAPEANREAAAVLPDDFIPEAWPTYLLKIQPILLNTCLECHNKDKGGAFQLERTSAENRRGSMNNLVATLKQIDRRNPDRSALLVKSISPHGGATLPPIRTWQSAVAKTLESWAIDAVRPAPNTEPVAVSRQSGEAAKVPPIVPPMPIPARPAAKDVPDLFPDVPGDKPRDKPASVPFASDSASKVESAKKPEPLDPFDPDIFNGKVAPKK